MLSLTSELVTRLDVQSAEERKDEQDRLGLDDVDNAEADKSPLVVMFEGVPRRNGSCAAIICSCNAMALLSPRRRLSQPQSHSQSHSERDMSLPDHDVGPGSS